MGWHRLAVTFAGTLGTLTGLALGAWLFPDVRRWLRDLLR